MPIAALWPLPAAITTEAARASLPLLSQSEFLAGLQGLLPPGRAWPRDPDTAMTATIEGWARAYARVHARQANLVRDSSPATTIELLPEWEKTLGLPDPCLGSSPTLQQRQSQVLARFTDTGGQSIGRLSSYAGKLGYSVAITEFAPFRAGVSRAGDALNGSGPAVAASYFSAGQSRAGDPLAVWTGGRAAYDWAHALRVTALKQPTTLFRAGQSAAGEPLADWSGSALAPIVPFRAGVNAAGDPLQQWGAPVLECELRRIAPAQATVIFAYSA